VAKGASGAAALADNSLPPTQQRGHFIALFVAALLLPAALGSSTTIFNDGDVSWHIATGQWIIDHRTIPYTDPFSFTWEGKPWVPIDWLAEVILAGAHRLAGYGGVAALITAALMAVHAIVFINASRHIRPLLPIVLMDFVLVPMLLARPHVLAWALLAVWTWLMLRAREDGRAPPLAAALLMVIWVNLHGSFVLGLGIAAAFGVEALVEARDRQRAFTHWLIFGLACAAAVFVNGNGIAGVVHPLRIANLEMLPLIDEWKTSSPKVTPFFFAALAIAFALIAWKRPTLSWIRWLLLAAMLALALFQVRHQATFAIFAALVLPKGFTSKNTSVETAIPQQAVLLAAAVGLVLLTVRAILPVTLPENEANPWKLIAAVHPDLRSQPVLNGWSMGGPLILSGIRPYVDGRGDMYGDELVVDYAHLSAGDATAFKRAVARWNVTWAILPHRNSNLIHVLERSGWRQIASSEAGVVYVAPAL
jgi:hypothetical protein